MVRWFGRIALLFVALLLACSQATEAPESTSRQALSQAATSILVVAPHPDDDIITSSGVIARAVRHNVPVHVVFMTNGDAWLPDGLPRQDEAVAAQNVLGVPEDNLMFLGYPDGSLLNLFNNYTKSTQTLNASQGTSKTYGDRGLGRVDYHRYKFGASAAYNRPNLIQDLVSILTTYQPTDIFTTNVNDAHDDHATTYNAITMALSQAYASTPGYQPTLHSTIVWASDESWPPVANPATYIPIDPNLWWYPSLVWTERESLDVPLSMQSTPLSSNQKARAIAQHSSQGGASGGFITRFTHKDEFFWGERTWSTNNRPAIVNAGLDQRVAAGATVQLDGSGSADPEHAALLYTWTQVDGVPVTLSDPTAARPTFVAPAVATVLTFELLVSDGVGAPSPPDCVTITVTGDGGVGAPVDAGTDAAADAKADAADAAKDAVADAGAKDAVADAAADAKDAADAKVDADAGTDAKADAAPTSDASDAATAIDATDAAATVEAATEAAVEAGPADDGGGGGGLIDVPPSNVNVALNATATASSSSPDRSWDNLTLGPDKAIDNVIDGFPDDTWSEWSSNGQGAGAWIQLTWTTPQTISRIVLWDRPNTDDQMTGGTLVFSDGSTLAVGALANGLVANTFTFAPKVVTSVRLNVTSVSATTVNVGLAEFQVF